jgi:hypothetical protein
MWMATLKTLCFAVCVGNTNRMEGIKTSESRLLEVLKVKSKKKTQVPNCPGAELSWCRNVLVPKCLTQVPNCPGAELSWCRNVSVKKKN